MSLALTDVVLTYPDGDRRLTALDRVRLHVARGELAAVVGPSGSGKSSLLAVAATLLRADAGRVAIAGRDTAGLTDRQRTALRRESVGIVFQQANLIPSLTALEQLQAMAHLRGGNPREALSRAQALLDRVGLTGSKQQRRPHQLSGGERQRVNLARALIPEPAVLVVDEPTSALDHERGADVMRLLVEVTHEHRTATVLVTHDRSLLDSADSIYEMADGKLTALAAAIPE